MSHSDWDGRHRADLSVPLSAMPYTVLGEQRHEAATVVLEAAGGCAPVVLIDLPRDQHGGVPPMTLSEARALAAHIEELADAGQAHQAGRRLALACVKP